ncbi:hypothetical protein LEMLEM_LOCUS3361 [Lemmus lemmus]
MPDYRVALTDCSSLAGHMIHSHISSVRSYRKAMGRLLTSSCQLGERARLKASSWISKAFVDSMQ